ncbi:MAG TPA: D-isomer specific 2-hydroxyacid dehydrogenase family protein [Candidatus Brocadiia bacterium]|nr:D-isomer specific 2-hydroxyacid dehydrogenase family protein [Candidatus Brocadiia bacterium]
MSPEQTRHFQQAARPRILCTLPWLPKQAAAILAAGAEVCYMAPERSRLLETIGQFDAWWLHFDTRCDREMLERASRLRVVCTATTGTDHIDREEAGRRGVRVLSIAKDRGLLDTFTATAELNWMLVLGLMRHMRAAVRAAHDGDWADGSVRFEGLQLRGRTLGVVGLGRLGTMTARYGNAFGMEVLGNDLAPVALPDVRQVDLPDLLKRSDVICIHVHLTQETRHLFDKNALLQVKHGAALVNTSRGDIVDEEAVIEALESGRLAGYAADVLHDEWNASMSHNPLVRYARDHDNVILTPHIGGATRDSVTAARNFTARKLVHFLRTGQELTWRSRAEPESDAAAEGGGLSSR